MARRRRRRRRIRPQKGGFYNGYRPVIVNKGINPRSWDNYGPSYLQRGGGGQKGGFLGPLSLGLGSLFSQIGGGRKRKQKGGSTLSRILSKKDKQRFRRRRAFEDKYLPDLIKRGKRKQKGGFFTMMALPALAAYQIGKTLRQSGV